MIPQRNQWLDSLDRTWQLCRDLERKGFKVRIEVEDGLPKLTVRRRSPLEDPFTLETC